MKQTQTAELTTGLTILMAIATGLVVASNYYAQPLLDTIAGQFNLTTNMAGFIVTAAQLGYAAGLLFLVPLGDLFERKRLILTMTFLSALGLLITALSNNIWQILLGTALTGLFSVVAQVLIPLAASIAKPHKRGKAVGMIMSGLLLGHFTCKNGFRCCCYGRWLASDLLGGLCIIDAVNDCSSH